MKYVTTHYPTFFRKSIIPTGVSIVLTLASFVQGWPLLGSGISIVTLLFLWTALRSCQIRLTVNERGVGFTKGKYRTAYPWACIESIKCWPEMTEFKLVGSSSAALFPAFDTDGREQAYQTIQAVIFEYCMRHDIAVIR
ncbi:MAG: hypothetical protein K6T83_08000 [Alicyclobacillus sp.]|nr:hypothetical protein [Alicyclobacillus sp.]